MNRIPTSPNDPVNTDILMVAEDRVKGFRRLPFHAIAEPVSYTHLTLPTILRV